MLSAKNLFPKMLNAEYIRRCIHRAARGKGNRPDVVNVLNNEDEIIYQIQSILQEGKIIDYIPKHEVFKINDGISKKVRYIVKPCFFEQIIHHMVMGVLKKHIMSGMYEYNCGSIPKRGGNYAKNVVEKYIHSHKHGGKINYCLKLDVHHFFQSINHLILKKFLMKSIKDSEIITILDIIIDTYSDHKDENGVDCGLPIGFYTSQWLANWYLQGLDHYIKQVLKADFYVRYMDDMVIFAESKSELRTMLNGISVYMNNLGLSINSKWQIFPFDKRITKTGKHLKKGRCVDFVGFKFYRDRSVLRKTLLLKYTRKIRKIEKQRDCNWFEATQIVSYHGWAVRCDLNYVRKAYSFNLNKARHCISKYKRKLNNKYSINQSRKKGVA